jgi:phage tail P2-like protein
MKRRAPHELVPASIADVRGRAFGLTMEQAFAEPDFVRLLFERIDTVDAAVLPFLVREFSMEEFIEPDMLEDVVRGLLKVAFELHAAKGFLHGVKRGLRMLNMDVVWTQWFEQSPKGQPGTHVATVFAGARLFSGQRVLLDERVQRAALRMIDQMKRWSQHVSFQMGVASKAQAGVAVAKRAAQVSVVNVDACPPRALSGSVGAASRGRSAQVRVLAADAAPVSRPFTGVGAAVLTRGQQFVRLGVQLKEAFS